MLTRRDVLKAGAVATGVLAADHCSAANIVQQMMLYRATYPKNDVVSAFKYYSPDDSGFVDLRGQSTREIFKLQYIVGDGTGYLSGSIIGTETVSSKSGTADITIEEGKINIGAGTLWSLTLSNGSKYEFATRLGDAVAVAYDLSGNDRHLALVDFADLDVSCAESMTIGSDWLNQQGYLEVDINHLRGDNVLVLPNKTDSSPVLPELVNYDQDGDIENAVYHSNNFTINLHAQPKAWTYIGAPVITPNYGTCPETGLPSTRVQFADGSSALKQYIVTGDIGITLDRGYCVSVYCKGPANGKLNIGGDTIGGSLTTLNGSWQRIYRAIAAGGAIPSTFFIGTYGGAAIDVEIACVQVNPGATPTPYVDNAEYRTIAPTFRLPPALATIQNNGLTPTPQMGWSSWNAFSVNITDAIVRAVADTIVSSGMKDAGYEYVNIDAGWSTNYRNADGTMQINSTRFPNGIKAVADYVHSKGLKFGIYSSPGIAACNGIGSGAYEWLDAITFASWGVDYVKYDWCSGERWYAKLIEEYGSDVVRMSYQWFAQAIRATGRPMVFSASNYGWDDVNTWAVNAGINSFRATGDISATYASMQNIGFTPNTSGFFGRPGTFRDLDMLQIGNGTLTETECKTHMSLWSLRASPLIAGNDVRSMSAAIKNILINSEVIAISQDVLGVEGDRVLTAAAGDGSVFGYAKQLSDGYAVGLFNHTSSTQNIAITWSAFGESGTFFVRDIWGAADIGNTADGYTATSVPSHGVTLLKLTESV